MFLVEHSGEQCFTREMSLVTIFSGAPTACALVLCGQGSMAKHKRKVLPFRFLVKVSQVSCPCHVI